MGISAYRSVELLLKSYRYYKAGVKNNAGERLLTIHMLNSIDNAVDELKDERYIDIIKLMYMDGYTAEQTADMLHCDIKTLFRNRKKLINKMKIIVYPDLSLMEFLAKTDLKEGENET